MIVKIRGGHRVLSESGRNMGSYYGRGSLERARKRLRQIKRFGR